VEIRVVTNPFQFAGREFDLESGLYFNRARHYDPSTGRFLEKDPIGYPYLLAVARGDGPGARAAVRMLSAALRNPQLSHPYTYALNNTGEAARTHRECPISSRFWRGWGR